MDFTSPTIGGGYDVVSKAKKLYVHYWISLLIFVPLACWVAGAPKYPGTLSSILKNVTAWDTTYDGEIWFLFPYMMVMLTSKYIVKVLDRFNPWICAGIAFFLSLCTGFIISRYGAQYLYNNQLLYKPILYVQFLFPFTLGAYMAKFDLVNQFKLWIEKLVRFSKGPIGEEKSGWIFWMLLIALVAFRCCFRTGAFHTLYVFAFIVLFVCAPRPKLLDSFLDEMGRRSTSMWFVHTYFCYYLFHDFIYSFKYPLLIFAVLLACSYVSAIVIDWINGKVKALIFK